jgi:hypothetical protein
VWGIRDTRQRDVDVTVPTAVRRRPRIRAHRATLSPDEITTRRGIRVTTPARTLLDLAAGLSAAELARAAHEAEARRLTSPTSLAELVVRHPRRPGVPAIRRLLEDHTLGDTITRSRLEDRFLALLAATNVPRPRVNTMIEVPAHAAFEADMAWPHHRVIVELDGFATHSTRRAFERDRARDRALQVAGWRVIRITWRQLDAAPAEIAAQLRLLLDDARARR